MTLVTSLTIYDAAAIKSVPTEKLQEVADHDGRCRNCGGYPGSLGRDIGTCSCPEELGRDYAPLWRLAELELGRRQHLSWVAERYGSERSPAGRDAIMQEYVESGGDVDVLIREHGDTGPDPDDVVDPEPFAGYDANVAAGSPPDGDTGIVDGPSKVIRVSGRTWARLQQHGEGFAGSPLGTPDKVISWLLDREDERAELPIDRPHRFAVGGLVRHVDAVPSAENTLAVTALTWRVDETIGVRFPTYELRSPTTSETITDVLDTDDLAAI